MEDIEKLNGYQRVYHELEPFWQEDSEILILGSLPSPKSRETGFYYGHPRNRFWKVLSAAYGENCPEDLNEKKELLKKHKAALWDVIDNCLIKGAADGSIKDPVANDIAGLLRRTSIKRIFTTGTKAYELYTKLVYPKTGIPAVKLPSTSPANCAMSEEELISFYRSKLFYVSPLMKGRPEDESGRTRAEMAVYDFLDRLCIEYDRVDHEAAYTMEACQAVDSLLGIRMCKNLFLCNAQKTSFYLLAMPGEKVFKTKYLSKQINSSRLSFAGEEYMKSFLGLSPGSASVLGLMNDHEHRVRLLIDRDLMNEEWIGCHPCINTSSLKLRMGDLLDKFLPAVGHEYTAVELPWEA